MRDHVAKKEHDDAPPSYAEATGTAYSPPLAGRQYHDEDEKRRLRQSLQPLSGSTLPQASQHSALEFIIDFKKPMLDFWTMNITPGECLPELSFWQLRYSTRHKATMRRHAPEPQSRLPLREIAEIKFPETVWPGCGPMIKFWPHEEEIERRGLRHASATDCFMHCTGWLTTKFGLDLPALSRSRVVWKVPKDSEVESNQPSVGQPTSSMSEKDSLIPPQHEHRNTEAETPSWTPFPTQHLVEESSDRVLAAYTRAAPWSKHQGHLNILQSGRGLTAEVIEGIVIATAAMVGMQDAIGMAFTY